MNPLAVLNFSVYTLNPRQHPPRPLLPSRPPSYSSFSCPSLPTNLPPRPPVANSKYHLVLLYNPNSKPSCKIKSENQKERSPCSAKTSKNLELMDEIDLVESCCGSSTEYQLMNPGGGHLISAAINLPP
ncbi:hypothetical protein S40288_11720 [Stachybotrys chartarum IBT 40288]|nr:hypothetical protein S40288_11720 [Stachybotrys chartarum IBT 40288]